MTFTTHRLTPLSAAFFDLEDVDATASLAIGSFAIFEGPAPAFEEVVATIKGRLPLIPRYRQRVRWTPLGIAAPFWEDVAAFDIHDHVRRAALPRPGGRDEIAQLVSQEMSVRMDRTKPLWEYVVVEGVSGGRWGLLSKVHHAMVDGVSGTDLYRLILDPSPEPGDAVPDGWEPQAPRSLARTTLQAVGDLAAAPLRLTAAAAGAARRPRSAVRDAWHLAQGATALAGALVPTRHTSLGGPLAGASRYTWTTVDLADVRLVQEQLPGGLRPSINDVALAAVAGGLRRLLLARGETPHEHSVRTLVPVSTRTPGATPAPGNEVSLLLPFLPVDLEDPQARLLAVHERIRDLHERHEDEAGGRLTNLAALSAFLPVDAGIRIGLRLPQQTITTVTTNVPGPREPLFCLGREALELLPYVPIADRVRVSIVMFSYAGTLTFGLTGDLATTADLDGLADAISASLDELVVASR